MHGPMYTQKKKKKKKKYNFFWKILKDFEKKLQIFVPFVV